MAETKDCEVVQVMGRRWDSSRPAFFTAVEGLSLESIVLQSIEEAYRDKIYNKAQRQILLKYARCRVNGVEKDRKYWRLIFPQRGDRIEILHGVRGGGGGGGGKNPFATILSVLVVIAAAVATFWAGGQGATLAIAGMTMATSTFTTGVGLIAAGMLMAINMLFPAKPPSIGGLGGDGSAEKTSPTYSISGGKNAHNVDGYVPLVLGRHRFTPPLGAKSWTNWAGDEQYFNMLVVWGHEHVTVSDFRIGDTALSKFKDVTHVFHQSTSGKGLKYFGWQYNEESVGATLTTGWTTRTVGICTAISVDIEFPAGLTVIDKNNGNRKSRTVGFEIQYKPTSGGSWKSFPALVRRSFGAKAVDCGPTKQAVGVSQAGNVHAGSGYKNLYPTKSAGVTGGGVSWKHKYRWETRYETFWDNGSGENGDYGGYYRRYVRVKVWYWEANVAAGSFEYVSGNVDITAAKQKRIVRSYRATGLPEKSYDVRIKRTSKPSTDSYIIDDCQWATMRAITQKPAFDTPVPICVSELRIKASEQLSGYVTEFSGLCYSKLPDWTPPTTKKVKGKTVAVAGHWNTWRNTRNPASIMRYLLTSRHSLIKPFSANRLDNASIVNLWNWCNKNGYTFDFIADSEENLWARLVQVLSPAMAGPTTDVDGLWGAIIDNPNKSVRQMFTPRNSWGISIQRGFARLPDALRVKFIDETDDWKQKEGFVYNDGFNKDGSGGKKKANDVVEWTFEGVTNWNRMYKLARYHLAQMLHRQMTVTLNTDWEWLAVHRGDLVGLSSDVLMNTFGTARIQRLVYQTSGKVDDSGERLIYEDGTEVIDHDTATVFIGPGEAVPTDGKYVGVELDDAIYYTSPSPARYGIAVRNASGAVNIIEVRPQYGEESAVVYFANMTQAAKAKPKLGDLVSVSLLGNEYEEYLVSSVTPGDNMSAQLTLVPFKAKEIYAAATKPIPAYSEASILDQVKGLSDLPTPTLKSVVSDERVARVSASGAVDVCIGGVWSLPPTTENLPYFTIQIVATSEETGAEITGSSTNSEEYAVAVGASVGKKYFVKIRIHDPRTGRQSAWSNVITHTVAGLVMPPPAPQNVRAVALYPSGVKLTWDAVGVVDLRRYVISGSAEGQTAGKECEWIHEPQGRIGTLTYNVRSLDTTDHLSESAGSASIELKAPKKPVIASARLENEGIVLTYGDARDSWPVTQYEGQCLGKVGTAQTLRCVVPFPENFHDGETAKVRGRDAFGNWGAWSDNKRVEIVPPLKPNVTVEVSETGTAIFRWQSCRTVTDIKHYVMSGASKGTTTGLYAVLPVEEIAWETVEETANGETVTIERGAISETVYAVDKWGIQGPAGGQSFIVWPPYNPIITVEKRTDGLHLKWQDCKRTFNISHYIVEDVDLSLTYRIDGTSQMLKPRAAGSYTFAVQAFDCVGKSSSRVVATLTLSGVDAIAPTAKVDGSDVVVEWAVPDSSWPIDYYTVYNKLGVAIGRCKTTFFRFPAPKEGAYEYGVIGKDIADNYGPNSTRAAITISSPVAPVVTPRLDGEGLTISWEPEAAPEGVNTLPIVAWDIDHWWEFDEDGDGVPTEANQTFGLLDATAITIPADATGQFIDSGRKVSAMSTGRHYFHVRGIDTAGNVGAWGDGFIDIANPGKVTFVNCTTIDNNIMLYWTAPDAVYFPIAYYLFESDLGQGDGIFAEVGRVDALFTSTFETEAGRYTYGVTPVDAAGNMGERTTIVMQVSQPPDFILYHTYDSLFAGGNCDLGRNQTNGGRTNFVLDHEGHMVGPYADATWNEQLATIATLKGVSASEIAWQSKIDWGYERWLDPQTPTASYVEIVDVGAIIPSTVISVTIDSRTIDGDPQFTCKVETSQDAQTWILISDDALMVHAGEFRYVRYTIGLSGGSAMINGINYKLDVKRKTDFGQIHSEATDNGDGYIDDITTPMLKGTFVEFNVDFADVSSLPKPNVVNHPEYTAYTVFEDVLYPTGFRLFVLDQNGNRVTADVDWSAFGV